ncbi:hypothetical protein V1477_010226 [Vespula maculifrons]|uniref:Uncharacterized protein n=1 Tax=Vespula maculifrons TaxID=7453 RepID=A0ABD2C7Z6_VESMC
MFLSSKRGRSSYCRVRSLRPDVPTNVRLTLDASPATQAVTNDLNKEWRLYVWRSSNYLLTIQLPICDNYEFCLNTYERFYETNMSFALRRRFINLLMSKEGSKVLSPTVARECSIFTNALRVFSNKTNMNRYTIDSSKSSSCNNDYWSSTRNVFGGNNDDYNINSIN